MAIDCFMRIASGKSLWQISMRGGFGRLGANRVPIAASIGPFKVSQRQQFKVIDQGLP